MSRDLILADALDTYTRLGWPILLVALIGACVIGAIAYLTTGPGLIAHGHDEPPSRLDELDRPRREPSAARLALMHDISRVCRGYDEDTTREAPMLPLVTGPRAEDVR